MSRRRIDGLDPKHEVWVGWDGPLQTFFGQVYDPERDEDENPVHWVGAAPPWLPDLDDLIAAMASYATLSAEMQSLLLFDRQQTK